MDTLEEMERNDRELAAGHAARWSTTGRRVLLVILSMTWLGLGGQALVPLGLIIALLSLMPDVPAWTRMQRFRAVGNLRWILIAVAAVGFLLQTQVGLFGRDGTLFYVAFRFRL